MLPGVGKIKKTAKEILSENHFVGIVACLPLVFSIAVILLVVEVLTAFANTIITATVSALLIVFMVLPLFVGTVRFFSRCVENVCDYPSAVFYYFSEKKLYVKVLSFIISLSARLVLSALLIMLPSMIIGVFSTSWFYELIGVSIPLWTPMLSTVAGLLLILLFIIFLIVNLKYYLCLYLFVYDEKTPPAKLMKQAAIISRRTQIDFVYLCFGMLLYLIASLLFLPLLFTMPIMITVYIIHSKCAVLQYNMTVDELNKNVNII